MSKAGSAAKVKLNSFDDLFGASDMTAGTDQVQEIPLSELYEFKGHPFKVLDDEKMQETVESIRNYGVLMPGIARPRAEGGYEIIAGHRRKHGCELAGLSTMPMFIRDYNDDEATVIMVDTNIQREDILPSEKARAYSMKYEAMKHQGKKGSGSSLDEVFDCENRYGELCPQQEKALEELGIPLPKPEQPKGKHNNRKQTFDAVCRTILFDIAKRHGLHLEQEPSYGGRDYLEKQDYILMKQKEQLATQEQKLEELTLKIEDVETLLEDVSSAAYDKAVEVVTDKVREQTQLEDMEVIEKYRKSVVSPNAKNSPEVVKIANTLLSRVREKLQQSAEKVLKKVQAVLLKPEVKQAGKEQIKNKARKSIKEKLAQGKLDADRENRERWEREGRIAPTRKQDMEL